MHINFKRELRVPMGSAVLKRKLFIANAAISYDVGTAKGTAMANARHLMRIEL